MHSRKRPLHLSPVMVLPIDSQQGRGPECVCAQGSREGRFKKVGLGGLRQGMLAFTWRVFLLRDASRHEGWRKKIKGKMET